MKKRVAEVSYHIEEIEVAADDNVHARDLVVKYLKKTKRPSWKSIRVRETADEVRGPARVLRKNG
jgi:hypothetical protein